MKTKNILFLFLFFTLSLQAQDETTGYPVLQEVDSGATKSMQQSEDGGSYNIIYTTSYKTELQRT
ncbi:MAG: hypothetical protein ACI86M_001101 [Saprospiraceae bacterium]|jgi:hypothetical protein